MAVIFTGGDNIQPSAYSHDDSNQLKVVCRRYDLNLHLNIIIFIIYIYIYIYKYI